MPANREYGRQDYDRACAYGDDWLFVNVTVTAFRCGVQLGSAVQQGIESDAGEDCFTEAAFNLSEEALTEARAAVSRLCTSFDSHPEITQ